MSFQGVCQVCESAPADRTCDGCGALVCDRHFEDDAGVCVQCASRVRGGGDIRGGGAGDFDVMR